MASTPLNARATAIVCTVAVLFATTARSQEPAPEMMSSSYPAAFFIQQGAVTALDMIQSLPGFAFRDTDGSRGYSGAAGNVLIDGRRPSSKTTQLRSLLRQIPVNLVERVELIRAGTPGVDMQGLPLIANVVRRKGASSTLALESLLKAYTNGDLGPTLRAEGSRREGERFIEYAAEVRRERPDEEAGDGPISRRTGDGSLLRSGRYVADYWTERAQASGNLEQGLASGTLRVNASVAYRNDVDRDITTQTDMAGLEARETVDEGRRVRTLGLGVDYDGQLGPTTSFQVLALQSLEWEDDRSQRDAAGSRQVSDEGAQAGESILRGTWRWQRSAAATVEAGAESAFNFLDARSALTRDSVSVALPAANVRVSELRGEAFATLVWQATATLSLDLGLRAETSRIETRGDVSNRNDFSFLKPRAQATWAVRDGTRLRLGVEREVGQLDFDDFAAGSEFANDTVNAGNPDLEPERAWVHELALEQDLPASGSLTLGYKRYDLEKVLDFVLVQGFAAPGNIGSGTRGELAATVSLPLKRGETDLGRFTITGTWRHSSVTDPLTGQARGISGEKPFEGDVTYTRDFPHLKGTFGLRGELTSRETQYRIDQVISERRGDLWRAYWDWRAGPRWLFRAQVENMAARDLRRDRVIYDGLRSSGSVAGRENRSARFDPFLTLRVRRTF